MERLLPVTLGLSMAAACVALLVLTACSQDSQTSGRSGARVGTPENTSGAGETGSGGAGGSAGTMATEDASPEELCAATGGKVGLVSCCLQTSDFPDQCDIDTCDCSPNNSHQVQGCVCPEGKCFDGTGCVPAG